MTKNIKIIIGIVILGAILLVMYFTSMHNNKNQTGMTSGNSKKMAFNQFIKQNNGSYECAVTQYKDGNESKGTIYVNNGNVRGDFNVKTNSMDVTNVFVIKDGYVYTWSSNPEVPGAKIKLAIDDTEASQSAPLGYVGDYNCKDWETSNAMFVIPSTIKFIELNR